MAGGIIDPILSYLLIGTGAVDGGSGPPIFATTMQKLSETQAIQCFRRWCDSLYSVGMYKAKRVCSPRDSPT